MPDCRFVAEVSSNHSRSLDRCMALIDCAAEIGCDAVKFQLFRVHELFAPEILARSEEHRSRKAWELPIEFLPQLAARCRARRLEFACTPFYLAAVDQLRAHVAFLKIASYELLWDDLLQACGRTGKPVALSTGMATLEEVQRAVSVLEASGCTDLTILHTVSGYPTPPAEANLAAMETLRTAFDRPVGWSDHTVDAAVILRAVHRWGASMVEFHLDLDGDGEEFGAGHCWLPGQMKQVISAVRVGLESDGNGDKVPARSELDDREWRADPIDGLRPLRETRRDWRG